MKARAEVLAVFEAYYTAVELADFDWALAYYSWEPVAKLDRDKKDKKQTEELAARENARHAAQLVKEQIEHNGGLRRVVAVHGLFETLGHCAVVEVEFNNGTRDLSPAVALIYEPARERERPRGNTRTAAAVGPSAPDEAGEAQAVSAQAAPAPDGEWKLEAVTTAMRIPPPLVGQREILATFETIYRAALASDFAQMREHAYDSGLFLNLKESKPEEREKRIARLIEEKAKRIQTAAHVNGGLVSIDVPRMQESTVYVYTKPGEEPIAIASLVIRRNFQNGKSEAWQTSFFLDRDGLWKVNPNTLR